MNFPDHIFKAYDIRGLVEGELSEDLAYKIGRAFVQILRNRGENLQNKKIVVGHDMRESSPAFQTAVTKGINDEGLDVVDIGLTSTPLFNFACAHYPEHIGGIMITASHNPAEYNGFKMTYADGLPLGKETGMTELKELAKKNNFKDAGEKGIVEKKDIYSDYETKVLSLVDINKIKTMKIVVDAGNGMAKVSLPKILENISVEVEYLYLEPDGNFPNHESNPLKIETLKDLQKKVVEIGADLGFALDGDADRIGLVDEKGVVVPASFVGGLIGLEVLAKNPASRMLYDLRLSRAVVDLWENAGATTAMTKVGHANIKKQMKEECGIFASELSLHLYYRDMYDVECTDLSLLYILKILSDKNQPLSEVWQAMNTKFHSGEINFRVDDIDKILQSLKEKYIDADLNELDGLLFTYSDYWFSVRASNTEPVLRLNLEADSEKLMQGKLTEVKNIIER